MITKKWPLLFMLGLICLITFILSHRLINSIHPDALNAYTSYSLAAVIIGVGIEAIVFLLKKFRSDNSAQLTKS
jgi:hypothetical protein